MVNGTVMAQQTTEGVWSGYGRSSGIVAALADSKRSQNHASINVISRPGAALDFLY